MIQSRTVLSALTIVVLACTATLADDWPQWLGAQRDGVWRETGIVESLPTDGLQVRWRAPVAAGYAGPAVADGRVFVADYVVTSGKPANSPSRRIKLQGAERVLCFDLKDGSLLWKHEYDCPYEVSYPGGPRVTPTVVGGKVYSLGTMGDLRCLDAEDGQLLWAKDFKKEFGAATPIWGFSGHPLVDGDRLICLAGGKGSVAVALNKNTGEEVWRALSAREPGYCPPMIVEHGGVRQLILWHAEAINGLDPVTGKVHWTVPLKPSYGMSIAAPRAAGDLLFASGIGEAAAVLKLDAAGGQPEIVWRGNAHNAVYCANSTPHIDGNVIFGVCRKGELRGVDLKTGKRLWETFAATTGRPRQSYGTAFLVRHDDRYFLFNEAGELILARLTADGYEELGRAPVLAPTNEAFGRPVVWSHPAFADRCIIARNDKEVVCVSLAANPTAGHTVPDDPNAVVVQYEKPVFIEGTPLPRSGPELQILADGTIVVHDPFGRPPGGVFAPPVALPPPGENVSEPEMPAHVKKITGKLNNDELQALLAFLIDEQGVFEFRVDNSQLHQILADANNTMILVQADGKSLKHVAYGLGAAGNFATEKNGLVQMRRIEQRLLSIRNRTTEQARAERK